MVHYSDVIGRSVRSRRRTLLGRKTYIPKIKENNIKCSVFPIDLVHAMQRGLSIRPYLLRSTYSVVLSGIAANSPLEGKPSGFVVPSTEDTEYLSPLLTPYGYIASNSMSIPRDNSSSSADNSSVSVGIHGSLIRAFAELQLSCRTGPAQIPWVDGNM